MSMTTVFAWETNSAICAANRSRALAHTSSEGVMTLGSNVKGVTPPLKRPAEAGTTGEAVPTCWRRSSSSCSVAISSVRLWIS